VLLLLSFVSIRIIDDADAFVVTTTKKPRHVRLSSSWSSRQRKTPYRCWKSKVVDDDETTTTAEQTQETSSPAHQIKLDKNWMERYESLTTFKSKHGHCNVPQNEGSLGTWVGTQRHMFKQEKMRGDRKKILDDIGFLWSGKWLDRYENLK
jgi:hypothetical protein